MPYVMCLWKSVQQEEGRAGAGLDSVDRDLGRGLCGYVEGLEALEHFRCFCESVNTREIFLEVCRF